MKKAWMVKEIGEVRPPIRGEIYYNPICGAPTVAEHECSITYGNCVICGIVEKEIPDVDEILHAAKVALGYVMLSDIGFAVKEVNYYIQGFTRKRFIVTGDGIQLWENPDPLDYVPPEYVKDKYRTKDEYSSYVMQTASGMTRIMEEMPSIVSLKDWTPGLFQDDWF